MNFICYFAIKMTLYKVAFNYISSNSYVSINYQDNDDSDFEEPETQDVKNNTLMVENQFPL